LRLTTSIKRYDDDVHHIVLTMSFKQTGKFSTVIFAAEGKGNADGSAMSALVV